ncbi:MAG: signal peptidase II, partial [Anaerolineae bacterium]|nr:signal peptidase II [Anaerolineae bacterium]
MFLLWVAASVIVFDQITKALVVANLAPGEEWMPIEAIRPIFSIHHITNTGAAFGLFQDGRVFFILIALVVIVIILYFYRQMPDQAWLLRIALG